MKTSIDPKLKETARTEYVTRNTPLRVLADRYGIPQEELTKVAEREDWATQREEYWRAIYEDVIHNTRTAVSQLMARTVGAADRLVRWADLSLRAKVPESGVSNLDPEDVNSITKALRTGLEVLKFSLGSPEDLLYNTEVALEGDSGENLSEAMKTIKDLLKSKAQ